MTDAEKESLGIISLPENLWEALHELSRDELLIDALGEHIYSKFMEVKLAEGESIISK